MGKKTVLVVSAHGADYCTRAGGAIAAYVKAGYDVHIVCLTMGCRGESGGYWAQKPDGTEEDCEELRIKESTAAAAYLGATIEFWRLKDYPLTLESEHYRRLTRLVLDLRPEVVLTHWINDPTNQDHALAANAIVRACDSAAQLGAFPNTPAHYFPNIYCFESTVPYSEFNEFNPDFYLDITDVYETKMNAIKKFECQPFLGNFYAHFAVHRGFQAKAWCKKPIQYAEGFKRLYPYVGKMLPETTERPEGDYRQ